jgi:transposase
MLVTQRFSNEMLMPLQRAVNAGSASMSRMRSEATTTPSATPAASARTVARLHAELTAVRAELDTVRAERDQLRGLLADLLADQVQLRAQLADTQAQLAAVEAERQATRQELVDLKRKPFTTRARSDDTTPAKPRGRAAGHPGSSRRRPSRIDHIQAIPAGDTCPDCGTPFTGAGTRRERVVEDIVLVRPTIITKYVIERRWCPRCRNYHEDAVTDALPRHRLGLHVLLFVVYQKVALGLSYSKIQRELQTYFGLTLSAGELPGMVAEIAALFGPAYARLLDLMRQQAAIHIDETSWRVDGVPHWLWVFVNDVVALYVVSRSRGSKVPQALLGPDFDGVAISDFFSAYSPLEVEKAKCWAHLLRDSHDYAKGQDAESERTRFHRTLHALFVEMGLALEQVRADQAGRVHVYDAMRTKLWRFATEHWRTWQCQQLAARIEKYLDDLLVWLKDPAVDPTNNMAERALRGAVVTRKTSFGSRSKRGAHAFARMLSIIMTWERQGKDFFTIAHQALIDACSQS